MATRSEHVDAVYRIRARYPEAPQRTLTRKIIDRPYEFPEQDRSDLELLHGVSYPTVYACIRGYDRRTPNVKGSGDARKEL